MWSWCNSANGTVGYKYTRWPGSSTVRQELQSENWRYYSLLKCCVQTMLHWSETWMICCQMGISAKGIFSVPSMSAEPAGMAAKRRVVMAERTEKDPTPGTPFWWFWTITTRRNVCAETDVLQTGFCFLFADCSPCGLILSSHQLPTQSLSHSPLQRTGDKRRWTKKSNAIAKWWPTASPFSEARTEQRAFVLQLVWKARKKCGLETCKTPPRKIKAAKMPRSVPTTSNNTVTDWTSTHGFTGEDARTEREGLWKRLVPRGALGWHTELGQWQRLRGWTCTGRWWKRKGRRFWRTYQVVSPLLMAGSQAAVAESEKHNCHQRTSSRKKQYEYILACSSPNKYPFPL